MSRETLAAIIRDWYDADHHDTYVLADAIIAAEPEPDYEALRRDRHWPTPNHMRSVAGALDTLTPARYGDVLRWVADLCDASLVGAEERA